MAWVKLDDRFPDSRKVAKLSDALFRFHVTAMCWCAANGTDGHIAVDELSLVSRRRVTAQMIATLVELRLWDTTESGWLIHDWDEYNDPAEKVAHQRKLNAERQRKFRMSRVTSRVSNATGERVSNGTPSRPVPEEEQKPKTAPRTAPPRKPRKDGPEGERADAIAKRFHEYVNGVCNFLAVKAVVLKCIKGGASDDAVVHALWTLDQAGKPITADTMRTALASPNGRSRPGAAPNRFVEQ